MSCKLPDSRYAFIKEGQCVWAQIGGGFLDLGRTTSARGFSESRTRVSGSVEFMIQPDWFAGFAVGYEHGNENTGSSLAKPQSNRAHFGAAVKYNPGPFLFAAAAYGGYGWYTTDRFMDFGGFNATAASASSVSRVGGQLRAAYLVDQESWYVKPILDLNLTRISLNRFREKGAGGADLIVAGTSKAVFSGSPAIEIGTQMSLPNDSVLRSFAPRNYCTQQHRFRGESLVQRRAWRHGALPHHDRHRHCDGGCRCRRGPSSQRRTRTEICL
jgi:outer membrane autotransporter protein